MRKPFLSSNHSNPIFLFRTIPLAQLWSCTQAMLWGITWKTPMAKPPPLQTDTNKQHISAAEVSGGPVGHFVSTSDGQCLAREGVAVSLVEWILPFWLENRALQKQTAVRARRSPSERPRREKNHKCWLVREVGVIGDPLQLHVWLPFEIKVCVFLRSGVKCFIVLLVLRSKNCGSPLYLNLHVSVCWMSPKLCA